MLYAAAHTRETVRPAAVAGMFYPASPKKLDSLITKLFDEARYAFDSKRLFGMIAPHAGYVYSGDVAASVFGCLRQQAFETVVVLSPSHRDYFEGVSVYLGDYETPFGRIPVDQEVAGSLLERVPAVFESVLGHREEHGIEVELPFLQKALGSFQLVPLVMGTQTRAAASALGDALSTLRSEKNILIVASSDLSHFHTQAVANQLDHAAVASVEAHDFDKFFDNFEARRFEACGYGPIGVAMKACGKPQVPHAKVVSYHTSGDISGTHDEVVGYLSALFYQD